MEEILLISRGLTLVELIVVILLLGVLSVSVIPRFQDASGVAEYGYQARLISTLRNIQQRAMQDTRGLFCYRVNLAFGGDSAFGPPVTDFTDMANQAQSCSSNIDTASDYLSASVAAMAADEVQLIGGPAVLTVEFNSMGCPVTATGACSDDIQIVLQGQTTTSVCVESQGYIHAC